MTDEPTVSDALWSCTVTGLRPLSPGNGGRENNKTSSNNQRIKPGRLEANMMAVRALIFASVHGGGHVSSRLCQYLSSMHSYGYFDGLCRGVGFGGSIVMHSTGQVRGFRTASIQSSRWSVRIRDEYGERKTRKGRTGTTKDRNRITEQYSRNAKQDGSCFSNSRTQKCSSPSQLHDEQQVTEARLELDSYRREQPMNRARKQSESYWAKEDSKKKKVKRNREKMEYSQAVYGIAPVLNSLKSRRREILELIMQRGLSCKDRKDKDAYSHIQQMTEELQLPVRVTGKDELNELAGNRPHQGFVLLAKPLEFVKLRSLPQPALVKGNLGCRNPLWLALDEITDPQNLGALLRSAHYFGVEGVVVSAKNSAGLTPVASKASAGALEVMTVHSTSNMMKFLRESRENGWKIIGTALREDSVPLSEISKVGEGGEVDNKEGIIVVLGNEGRGMRTNVIRECDVVVKIPGKGSNSVDSLNVSVTGALLLYGLLSDSFCFANSNSK